MTNPNETPNEGASQSGDDPIVLTSGIGSLPHACIDSALQFSFRCHIPYLPQIPIRNKKEFMITQALEQLPGPVREEEGHATLDYDKWQAGTQALKQKTDAAFSGNDEAIWSEFEPSPETWSCWKPFLFELQENSYPFAKIQIAGPMTCQWALRLTDESPADRNPEIGMQIFRLVLARAIAMSRRLQSIGVTPLLYIDEPGFYGFSAANPRHAMALQELRLFIQTLRKHQTLVGLHCCSNTDWKTILTLPFDVLAFDTHLSLNLVLSNKPAVRQFTERGGRFSLGVVPTGTHSLKIQSFRPKYLWAKLLETFESHFGNDPRWIRNTLSQALFTPACGMALHTISDAEAILGHVLEVARRCETYLGQSK